MNTYYLTVTHNGADLIRRVEFSDFSDAIEYTYKYYEPRSKSARTVLSFTSELLHGQFTRAYAQLNNPDNFDPTSNKWAYQSAIKQSNKFIYDGSYLFLVETDLGIQDCKEYNETDD